MTMLASSGRVDRTGSLTSRRPWAAIWLIFEELISRVGAGNRDVREVFPVHGTVAVLLAGRRENDVALCELVAFLLGFNKALALGYEQNLIAAMDVHSGVGAVIEVDYVNAHLLALVGETLARNVFGTVEEFGCAAHALARHF
jgi:hypothetical protein